MKTLALTVMLTLTLLLALSGLSVSHMQGGKQIIEICKNVEAADGTVFPFMWTTKAGTQPSFTVKAGECVTKLINPGSGPTVFNERLPADWHLTHISCTGDASSVHITGADNAPGFQTGDNTVTVDSGAGNIRCTFTNEKPVTGCCNFQRDLSTGQNNLPRDPFWSLKPNPAYLATNPGSWIELPPAKWLQPNPGTDPSAAPGQYDYVITFDVPACTGGVSLKGIYAADNSGKAFLDGNLIPGSVCDVVPPAKRAFCFTKPAAPVPLNLSYIAPGTHTLKIEVGNENIAGWNSSGLVVNAHLTNLCLEKKKINVPRN